MTKYILIISILIAGCSRHKDILVDANLKAFCDTTGTTNQFEGFQAGGEGKVKNKNVKHFAATSLWNEEKKQLEISFSDTFGFIESVIPHLALPINWKKYKILRVDISNPNADSINAGIDIYGTRNVLYTDVTLAAGERKLVDISLLDLPLAARNTDPYEPNSIHIDCKSTKFPSVLIMHKMSLVQTSDSFPHPVVDEMGQRINSEWLGKLKDTSELKSTLENEKAELQAMVDTIPLDLYGGRMGAIRFDSTGFFHLAKKDGRWWFVTPQGNPFWSLGVTGVRTKYTHADVTKYTGREFLFKAVPPKGGKFDYAWQQDSMFSYYCWNVLRKYGNLDAWQKMSVLRLHKWGMNTIGNWSEDSLLRTVQFPFTKSYRTTEIKNLMLGDGLPDVFNPEYAAHVDSLFADMDYYKNNPWLIGYFVDNEQGWEKVDLLNKSPDNAFTRKEWESRMRTRYFALERINKAWATNYISWDSIRLMRGDSLPTCDNFKNDYLEFEKAYTEKYFSIIKDSLKKHDPNHLYLGCRFTRQIKPAHIVQIAGKYSDVVTVNVYRLVPDRADMTKWYELSGRPILIGEHHLPFSSARQLPPKYKAFTADERLVYYPQYVLTWAAMPFSLGSHWYQYVDQHITGRAVDGENQTVGLLDITDRPYEHMVKAVKDASSNFYSVHSNSK